MAQRTLAFGAGPIGCRFRSNTNPLDPDSAHIVVTSVKEGSAAEALGVQASWRLAAVEGEALPPEADADGVSAYIKQLPRPVSLTFTKPPPKAAAQAPRRKPRPPPPPQSAAAPPVARQLQLPETGVAALDAPAAMQYQEEHQEQQEEQRQQQRQEQREEQRQEQGQEQWQEQQEQPSALQQQLRQQAAQPAGARAEATRAMLARYVYYIWIPSGPLLQYIF